MNEYFGEGYNLAERLMALGFDPRTHFRAQDDGDGKGPRIVEWFSAAPMCRPATVTASS